MSQSHLLTGPKLILYVNGRPYYPVVSCNYTLSTPVKEQRSIDLMTPFQLDPTIARCSGTLAVVRLARHGGAEGAGLVAPVEDLPNQKYFSLSIVDRSSDVVIWEVTRAMLEAQSWGNEARALVTGQLSFVGTGWRVEVAPVTRPRQS